MAIILNIETATQFCSVALSGAGELLVKEGNEKNAHSQLVTLMINDLLTKSELKPSSIDAVAVSMGPGSYTGLRIGVSVAKGLCYALDKPLLAISTLQAMAAGMKEIFHKENDQATRVFFCPMIDARRMEVYSALYSSTNQQVREIKAEIIDESSFAGELTKGLVVFGGDGAAKCKTVLANNPNAFFLDGFHPSAQYMAALAEEKFVSRKFENVAYFEPFYLKDFIAALPRVKGLQ